MAKKIGKRTPSEVENGAPAAATAVRIGRPTDARDSKVRFGNVTISGAKPSAELVRINVERSTEALERITRRLTRPGVSLRAKKDVPRFSVDEDHPDIFIRRLNGRTERGRLVNGTFEVID